MLTPLRVDVDPSLSIVTVEQRLSQSIVVLAAVAGARLEHHDGTDVTPVIDFVPLAIFKLINPQNLDQRVLLVSPHQDLHVLSSQSLVFAKGSPTEILDDREKMAVAGDDCQRILSNLWDR